MANGGDITLESTMADRQTGEMVNNFSIDGGQFHNSHHNIINFNISNISADSDSAPVQSQRAASKEDEEKPTVTVVNNLPVIPSAILVPQKEKKSIPDEHLKKYSNYFWVLTRGANIMSGTTTTSRSIKIWNGSGQT